VASNKKINVGLFVTCFFDMFRPSVGFASMELLQKSGCVVHVPESQTCCGRPAYNTGDRKDALELAKASIADFQGFDYVVAQSGSCAGMISHHYPKLFAGDPQWNKRARNLAARTFELVSFLADVLKIKNLSNKVTAPDGANGTLSVTYHDSCAGLRELNIGAQPRKLLADVDNLEIHEMNDAGECCGFGGTFCVKYPEVSGAILDKKLVNIRAANADLFLAGDMGCLLNIGGRLARTGQDLKVRHIAEVLNGDFDIPPLVSNARDDEGI
jgi:L-lactate dehydrogenase complex protein LldE